MAIIHGQIESLKRIKKELSRNGITRFNSVAEMKEFLKTYDQEKRDIRRQHEQRLRIEIAELHLKCNEYQSDYEKLKNQIIADLNSQVEEYNNKYRTIESKMSKNFFRQFMHDLQLNIIEARRDYLQYRIPKIVKQKTSEARLKADRTNRVLQEYLTNKEKILADRCTPAYKELDLAKRCIEDLDILIAGAIGENLVVEEISKLLDKYHLFNDFSLKFNPPIYNRKEKDRIYSIQIDHLLIGPSGVFILETKNWSKQSIESLDLRSPVKQILRTSYALYTILNGDRNRDEINLNKHHWGNREIPVHNVVVMIHAKPKEQFNYVKIKKLSELNIYISRFDSIFTDSELSQISAFLTRMQKQS